MGEIWRRNKPECFHISKSLIKYEMRCLKFMWNNNGKEEEKNDNNPIYTAITFKYLSVLYGVCYTRTYSNNKSTRQIEKSQ